MAWPDNPRPAKSLVKLRDQINEAWPNRNKASDGMLGDAAHQAVASDHNPNAAGVVTAFDITNSPQTGFDAHILAEHLREKPHPDLKYIISNSHITLAEIGWAWGYYEGIDPHDTHIHISVGRGPDGQSTQPYDDITNWNIIGGEPMLNKGDVINLYNTLLARPAKQVDVDNWIGKPFHDLFYFLTDSDEHKLNFYINNGDMENLWPTFTGHAPTNEDKTIWVGKIYKPLVYDKLWIEAKNRIK